MAKNYDEKIKKLEEMGFKQLLAIMIIKLDQKQNTDSQWKTAFLFLLSFFLILATIFLYFLNK